MFKIKIVLVLVLLIFNSILIYNKLNKQTQPTIPLFEKKEELKQERPKEDHSLVFINYPAVANTIKDNSLYADIINHTKTPFLDYDKYVNAHETTHMINNDIREKYKFNWKVWNSGARINAFYIFKDKAVIIEEPNILKNDIIPYIPKSLSNSFRYRTYIVGQQEWNEQPLYIFDEWTAYVNDSVIAIYDDEPESWSDHVYGPLEFSIYSIALAMAVKDKDITYFENNKQFMSFLNFNLQRSEDVFKKGFKHPNMKFDEQDKMLNNLQNSPDAQQMRNFIKQYCNNVFLDIKNEI